MKVLIFMFVVLFISGCGVSVPVEHIEASNINIRGNMAVGYISNDLYGIKSKIESQSYPIALKNNFADFTLSGNVEPLRSYKDNYIVRYINVKVPDNHFYYDKYYSFHMEQIPCYSVRKELTVYLKISDKNENIIFSKPFVEEHLTDTCSYENFSFGEKIAKDFVSNFYPYEWTEHLKLKEEGESYLTAEQKENFKKALNYADNGNLIEAKKMFLSLTNTGSKNVYFNLYAIEKSLGNYSSSDMYFKLSN